MGRIEAFTYNGVTIGLDGDTHVLDRFGFHDDPDACEFVCEFLVANPAWASTASLETKCKAIETALRTANADLSVDWGGTNVLLLQTNVNAGGATLENLGFNHVPTLRKLKGATDTGVSRGYEFRCPVGRPPNYTDAYGTAKGRRTSDVNLHYDVNERRSVTITGAYTNIPTKLSRVALLADIDSYSLYRLALIDNTATWAITQRDERDDNFQAVTNFTRGFSEHVNGRLGSTVEIHYLPTGQRMVTIRGSYLRTTSPYAPAAAASANYSTYEDVHSAAALAGLTVPLYLYGGAGTPNCELVDEVATPNEQDDRLDFARQYRELLFQQSGKASGLKDPEVIMDVITFAVKFRPTDDSPTPSTENGGTAPQQSATTQQQTSGGDTVDKSLTKNPNQGTPPTQTSGSPATVASTPVFKPDDIYITYRASIRSDVLDLRGKYEADIRPYLLNVWPTEIGSSPILLLEDEFNGDPTSNTITAYIHGQSLLGELVSLKVTDAVLDYDGLTFDAVADGVAHDYLVQQKLPWKKKSRTVEATYKTGSGFDVTKFLYKNNVPGYCQEGPLIRGPKIDTIIGIPGRNVAQLALTHESVTQNLRYVNAAVQGSTKIPGGGAPPNGAATSNGSTSTPTAPKTTNGSTQGVGPNQAAGSSV